MRPEGTRRTHAHCSAIGSWRFDVLAPARILATDAPVFTAYDEWNTGFTRRREVPQGFATLLINLGDNLVVEHPPGVRTRFGAGTAFVAGLNTLPAISETARSQRGAQVMLTPAGAHRLLGRPLEELGETLHDPADLLGGWARDLIGRLTEAGTAEERLMLLHDAVARRLVEAPPLPPDLSRALWCLRASAGRMGIGALAADLGRSRKHVSVTFRRAFGMPPKTFARVLRFDRAVRLLRAGCAGGWADLALRCGYADQAHLAREFRALSGDPPTAFAARLLPDGGGVVD